MAITNHYTPLYSPWSTLTIVNQYWPWSTSINLVLTIIIIYNHLQYSEMIIIHNGQSWTIIIISNLTIFGSRSAVVIHHGAPPRPWAPCQRTRQWTIPWRMEHQGCLGVFRAPWDATKGWPMGCHGMPHMGRLRCQYDALLRYVRMIAIRNDSNGWCG